METIARKLHSVLWAAPVFGVIPGRIPGAGSSPKPEEPVATAVEPTPAPPVMPAAAPEPAAPAPCLDCGVVESIREIQQTGKATGLGTVAGSVAGALIGSQIGKDRGNTAAVLGIMGGAVDGRQIENQARDVRYEIRVRFEDGITRMLLTQDAPPA